MTNLNQGSFGYIPKAQEKLPSGGGSIFSKVKGFIIEDKFILIGLGVFGILVLWGLITVVSAGKSTPSRVSTNFTVPSYSSSPEGTTSEFSSNSQAVPLTPKLSPTPSPSVSVSPSPTDSVSPSPSPSESPSTSSTPSAPPDSSLQVSPSPSDSASPTISPSVTPSI